MLENLHNFWDRILSSLEWILGILFSNTFTVIGFVLAPIAEEKLGAGLQSSAGSYWPLVSSPISLVFCAISLVLLIWPIVKLRQRGKLGGGEPEC